MHAERVVGDPQAVRWVAATDGLPVGRVRVAPGALGELFCDGTLSAGLVEHGAVWLWVPDGRSWSSLGTRVQRALRDALADPSGWTVDPDPGEVLQRVTAEEKNK